MKCYHIGVEIVINHQYRHNITLSFDVLSKISVTVVTAHST